jgi:spore coat protein JB
MTRNCNSDRQRKMLQVQMADFALIDANLYLDTHPGCQQAMEYFQQQYEAAQRVRREYVELYGPLTVADSAGMDTWTWVETPWPWELEA